MTSTPEAEAHNRRAQRLWEQGQFEDAVGAWREANALEPDHLDALMNLAWALSRLGRVAEALPLAERAVRLAPGDWHARHALGHVHYEAARYAEAAREYAAAIEAGGEGALLQCDLGDARYSEGEFAGAAQAYAAALAEQPDDAYIHLWLGWSLQQIGERTRSPAGAQAEAAEHFERALSLAPDWPEALYAVGQGLTAGGEFERARRFLERALQSYPEEDEEGRAAAACELANALRGLGGLERAVALYHDALALDPTHPTARFNLGLTYTDIEDYENAIAQFDIVVHLDPDDADARLEKAGACMGLGRHDDAVAEYLAALEAQPDFAEAHAGLGLAYHMMGLHDLSVEQYQHAVRLAPDDPWSHYNLALACDAGGRYADADAYFEHALALGSSEAELCASVARAITAHGRDAEAAVGAARLAVAADPEDANAQDALAMALYSSGRYEEALRPAQGAGRLAPQVPEYSYDLGLVEESNGDTDRARQSYQRALELAPEFEEAREALRRLGEDV